MTDEIRRPDGHADTAREDADLETSLSTPPPPHAKERAEGDGDGAADGAAVSTDPLDPSPIADPDLAPDA